MKVPCSTRLTLRLPSLLILFVVSGRLVGQVADAALPALATLRAEIDTGHAGQVLAEVSAQEEKASATGRPAPVGLHRISGLAYYAMGQLRPADTEFAAALKEDPRDQESAAMRGLVLVKLGRAAEAIPLLESVRTSSVKDVSRKADPNYILALCYIDVRRYDDARHAFAAQFDLPPDSAAAYLLAARLLLRREYLPVAQDFAAKAVQLMPNLPLAHALLGEIALAQNHVDTAISEFEKERASNPLEPSVYDRLGDAYGRASRYEDAQLALQQAVLLEPNSTGPYILLGKTLLRRGDALGAATYLERAVKMDPDNFMSHGLLAQAYRAIGRKEDAAKETATAQRIQAASEPKLQDVR